jgi:hypothetical protein
MDLPDINGITIAPPGAAMTTNVKKSVSAAMGIHDIAPDAQQVQPNC